MATLADVIASTVATSVKTVIDGSEALLTRVAVAGGRAVQSSSTINDTASVIAAITGIIGTIPVVGTIITDLNPLKAVEDAGGHEGRAFGSGFILGTLGWTLLEPLVRELTHGAEALFTSQIFDPATAATLAAKGIISKSFGESEAGGGGLDASHFDQLLQSALERPAIGEALRLHNLNAITDAQLDETLQHNAVHPDFWGPLKELARLLLSPADLALANLRGEMDASTMYGYAQQLGLQRQDMDVLVANTGEPLGLMQLLEAYRRGIIPKDRLERGIRQSRVRNEWIDVAEALRYQPPDPGIVVQGVIRHAITSDQGRALVAERGINPDDWDLILAAHGRPIAAGEALELFNRGEMTADQVAQAIRQSDIRDEYIPDIQKLARRLIPPRTISTIVHHGIKDKAWAIDYLRQWGYTADDAAALVGSAVTSKTLAIKQATERQIIDLFEARAITKDEAIAQLANIGYDSQEAAFILEATDASATLKEQNRAVNAIRASFLADRIDTHAAGVELDALGLTAQHRDKLISEWQIERASVVKGLTEGQMVQAYGYGIWSREYATNKLVALGYSQADATVLLDIKDKGPGPNVPPLDIGGPR